MSNIPNAELQGRGMEDAKEPDINWASAFKPDIVQNELAPDEVRVYQDLTDQLKFQGNENPVYADYAVLIDELILEDNKNIGPTLRSIKDKLSDYDPERKNMERRMNGAAEKGTAA